MGSVVFFHGNFDHGAFLRGKYDKLPLSHGYLSSLTTEDEVFRAYVAGTLPQSYVGPEAKMSLEDFRTYHVDEGAGEVWTRNPETGATLSSGTWVFEEASEVEA
jgi:hypothetical protein